MVYRIMVVNNGFVSCPDFADIVPVPHRAKRFATVKQILNHFIKAF